MSISTETINMSSNIADSTDVPAPKRQCLRRENLMEEGLSFGKWIEGSDNVYISKNLAKYYKKESKPESIWINPFHSGYRNSETEEDLIKFGEYVKNTPHLSNSLEQLEGKTLGCWCKKDRHCHAETLIKLFKEKFMENKSTTTSSAQ